MLHVKTSDYSIGVILVSIAITGGVEQVLDPNNIIESCGTVRSPHLFTVSKGSPVRHLMGSKEDEIGPSGKTHWWAQSVIRQVELEAKISLQQALSQLSHYCQNQFRFLNS